MEIENWNFIKWKCFTGDKESFEIVKRNVYDGIEGDWNEWAEFGWL